MVNKKDLTLDELTAMVGKDRVRELFIEHYLVSVSEGDAPKVADGLSLEDIME